MQKLVNVDTEKCIGCNRCINACPIETANIVYKTDSGAIRVKIDDEKCIACGACIAACRHGSRFYIDDTERFIRDLRAGERISVFAAPAARTNNSDIGRVYAWLKQMGVRSLFDVSLGADICTWAHIRYIQEKNPGPLISQPCPAIVEYVTRHNNRLMKYISPVQSPMMCTAVYMRKYAGITDKIAALSPCIAKAHEFEATGRTVEYNVTFDKLWSYIEDNGILLPDGDAEFDHEPGAWGRIYSMPGGLKENVAFYLGNALRIDQSEGQGRVYRDLDLFAEQSRDNLPALFDVLNCPEGCNLGTGCRHERNIFEINTVMEQQRLESPGGRDREYMDSLFDHFDENLRLSDFTRTYQPSFSQGRIVNENDIGKAMLSMLKTEDWQRNFDCGACGSDTCYQMARKIALGTNLPENCVQFNKRMLAKEATEVSNIHKVLAKDVDELTEAVGVASKGIDDIAASFNSVSAAVTAYDNMVTAINGVANRITLVAINAKIEAARLGHSGKGFAVVAQEVQDLAKKSKKAVEEAENISGETTNAVRVMGEAVHTLDRVVELVADAAGDIEKNVTILEEM